MKNWDNLTLREFAEIRMITNNPFYTEDERVLRIAAFVGGIEYDVIMNLPLSKAREYVDAVQFLYEKPAPIKAKNKYQINGKTYTLLKASVEMTTAQYIDYQSIIVEDFESHLIDLLSIMLVPQGHNYNDGYDLDEAKSDLETMMVTEALGITDFFLKRYRRLLRRTLLYSKAGMIMATLKAPKEMKEEMKTLTMEWDRQTDALLSMCGSLSLKKLLA